MDHPEKRTYFDTTDEFYFGRDAENDLIQLNFGPMRVQLSNYAAHDLAYRLSAFLLLLDGGKEAQPVSEKRESMAQPEAPNPENVLYLGRKRNEQ